jgi:hypothetical protein
MVGFRHGEVLFATKPSSFLQRQSRIASLTLAMTK